MTPRSLPTAFLQWSRSDMARHAASQWIATAIVGLLTFALQIAMARALGPSAFSVYGIAMSAAGILMIVQDGGFRSLIYREATQPTPEFLARHDLVASAIGWNLVVTLAISTLILAWSTWQASLVGLTLVLLILANGGRVVSSHLSSLLRAIGSFYADAMWQASSRAITVAVSLVALVVTGDLIWTLIVGAVAQVAVLFSAIARRHLVSPRMPHFRLLWKTSLIFIAADLLTSVYFRSDILLLKAFGRDDFEIGVYSAATRLVESYVFFVGPIAAIAFRSIRLRAFDDRSLDIRIALLGMLLALPALFALGLSLIWPEIMIRIIFGNGYASAAAYLPWLMLACVAVATNAMLGSALIARNQERRYLFAVLGTVVVNLALNCALIPGFGAWAAAVNTAATEFALLALLGVAVLLPRPRSHPLA